jgi:hypothetical protein
VVATLPPPARTLTTTLRCACVIALASVLVAGSAAAAGPARARASQRAGEARSVKFLDRSKLLWATVDVCNTAAHPHVLGLRASMPGTGHRKHRMLMRFRAQFLDAAGHWTDLPDADSGFQKVGSGIFRARRSGWTFMFAHGQNAGHSLLRGLVDFKWIRRDGKIVHTAQLPTTDGHPTGKQGDPRNYSAATCSLG